MNALPNPSFRRISLTTLAVVLGSLLCGFSTASAQQAHPAVHPFEEPPGLEETTPNAPVMNLLRLQAVPAEVTCHPQGSVTRTGNDVYVKLNVVRAKFTINNPDPNDPYGGDDPVELRSYGGCHAGPTIEVLPGNALHIDLINALSADDLSCQPPPLNGMGQPAGVGCFNTINLHTHGLHVSPSGNSDNVLLNIPPQTTFPYEINIPSDHPAGTFWYHAHRHGSTATQVASGASGILVIRGNRPYAEPTPPNPHPLADIDTILHGANGAPMAERLFLFQQIPYACFSVLPGQIGGPWQQIFTTSKKDNGLYNADSNGKDPDGPANSPWICPKPDDKNFASVGVIENFGLQMFSSTIWDTNGRFTSVNGIVEPTISLKAGEIQRWRFVHAGIHDTINVQLVHATVGPRAEARISSLISNSALAGNREQQEKDLLAACNANEQTLIPQFEIAVDGLTRKQIQKVGYGGAPASNYLQPGYRSDVLVVFPSDGDYCLLDQAAPADQRANPSKGTGGGQGPSIPQLLAYVHVRGGQSVSGDLQEYVQRSLVDANPKLPEPVRQKLLAGDISPWAPFLELPPPPAANLQQADFAINFPAFQINGASYDPDVVNIKRQVDTSDDWILTAEGEPHIFHIHVNPFEIMDVTHLENGVQVSIFDKDGHCKTTTPELLQNQYCGLYHTFRDTIFVENNYQVRARTYYDRYIGEFVIHCHILDHEDAGMMLNIEIVPDLNASGGGTGMAGMRHSNRP